MKTNRYTEPQILSLLKQAQSGVPVAELGTSKNLAELSNI